MKIQLQKINFGRKRFLKTEPLNDFLNWMTHLAELKKFISNQSGFQIVGKKVYFEMSSPSINPIMMLDVIGPPIPLEQNSLVLTDIEKCDRLVNKILDQDIFTMDQDSLLKTAWSLKKSLMGPNLKEEGELSPIFHIVFNEEKIELHFFRQKDYIQKQF